MNATRDRETRTYRGRTLEEVLPKIKADLGPDAVIVRQRDGLTGGVGGFFQRQCIEVDAHAPEGGQGAESRGQNGARFDAYDGDEAILPQPESPEAPDAPESFVPETIADPATAEGLSSPAIQEMLRQAAPFADQRGAASEDDGELPAAPLPAAYAAVRPETAPALPVRGPGRGR